MDQIASARAKVPRRHIQGIENSLPGEFSPQKYEIIKGPLVHPQLNQAFNFINGASENESSDPASHNYFSIRDLTKSVWVIYPILQMVGLVNERAEKLAKAFYGACWSIVYSCYRPFKEGRDQLTDEKAPQPISNFWKKTYNANEHFRLIMGSIVSAIYGGGAFGMLWGALTNNDDLYEKSQQVYKTGMFNQNQIFASMNAAFVMKRAFNPNQLTLVDRKKNDIKALIEGIDTVLFIPNIITRTLDTLKLFGLNIMSEGLERFVNFLGYFSYGTWAARFGIMKTKEEAEGGDLQKSNPTLYNMQKAGGQVFFTLLPALSWISAGAELLGLRDLAEKTFKLEGICERLNPTISAWCLANPWLRGYFGLIKSSNNSLVSETAT